MCPNDWRFNYSYGIARSKGKHDPFVVSLRAMTSLEEVPADIREEFGDKDPFLYKDDDFAIVYDAEEDMPLHLLFIPINHIENFDVLNHLGLLRKMFLMGDYIVKQSSGLKEAYLSVSSKKESFQGEYFKHFHMHLQSKDHITKEELMGLISRGTI
jgi:diadenosine tetraphosphate (Ap4A) HIT family hydrolase